MIFKNMNFRGLPFMNNKGNWGTSVTLYGECLSPVDTASAWSMPVAIAGGPCALFGGGGGGERGKVVRGSGILSLSLTGCLGFRGDMEVHWMTSSKTQHHLFWEVKRMPWPLSMIIGILKVIKSVLVRPWIGGLVQIVTSLPLFEV